MKQTPKEKAIDLVFKKFGCSKQYALIAVDEILNAVTTIADKKYDYYLEVKQEIEKL